MPIETPHQCDNCGNELLLDAGTAGRWDSALHTGGPQQAPRPMGIQWAFYRCPACGFTVFNPRVTRCEACHAPLPDTARYTAADRARLEQDAADVDRKRAALAREAEEQAAERERRRGDGG